MENHLTTKTDFVERMFKIADDTIQKVAVEAIGLDGLPSTEEYEKIHTFMDIYEEIKRSCIKLAKAEDKRFESLNEKLDLCCSKMNNKE